MNVAIYSFFTSLALRMSVITVFVMLIKLILRDKLSAAAHCTMWIMLPIQTLFCIANIEIPSRTSIYNAMSDVKIPAITEAAGVSASYDTFNLIAVIYAIGVIALAIWYVSVYIIHCIKVSGLEEISDTDIKDKLEEIKLHLKINKAIVICKGVHTHMLSNIIVLGDGCQNTDIDQILTHELYHYKNKDNLKLWLAMAVVCLNWFNPIMWLAFMWFKLDIEMCCDDSVIRACGSRKEYAKVLVKTASPNAHFIPGTSNAANGVGEVTRRVKRIISWKKKKPIWLIAAIFGCVCVSCLCLTEATSTAVETVVPSIKATPEPVSTVGEMIERAIPTSVPMPSITPEKTAVPIVTPKREKTENMPNPVQPTPEQTSVPADNLQTELGEKISESLNGSKEIYARDDGSTVILQYDDGELKAGYIIGE